MESYKRATSSTNLFRDERVVVKLREAAPYLAYITHITLRANGDYPALASRDAAIGEETFAKSSIGKVKIPVLASDEMHVATSIFTLTPLLILFLIY